MSHCINIRLIKAVHFENASITGRKLTYRRYDINASTHYASNLLLLLSYYKLNLNRFSSSRPIDVMEF